MTHKKQVDELRVKFCNNIESLFEENSVIEFNNPFMVFISALNTFDESIVKDCYIVKEMRDGKYLAGEIYTLGESFDDLSIYELEDINEVAHILDEIQIKNFKILQDEND